MTTADVTDSRVQRVNDGVADSEKLIGLLKEFVEKRDVGSAYHIAALRKALTATIIQLHEMKTTGQAYKPSAELVELWWEAGDALQSHDPVLADTCRAKAFGWASEEDWDVAEAEGKNISVQDMKEALKRLVGEHAADVEEAKALRPEKTDVTRFLPKWILEEQKQRQLLL
jgi:hypothetical protein